MKFEKKTSAGYLANHMARLFAKGMQERIRPLGIAIGQFPILLELWQGDGVSQKELLNELDVEQATLANTLNRMERDGLIKRTKHPADARAQQIWLTEQAKQLRNEAYQSAQDQNEYALGALNDTEQAQLMDFMRRIIGGLRSS
ncbi:MAG: winged helix-turn-helix transcriptional regulator [Alphaproteobacteria bacterium]|nr:winged helix-turn-helix transcriptional regulator [Alphaproteobacteria bacterium]